MTFLKSLAHKIYNEFGNDISDFTIVFPNIRTSYFFQSYLSEIVDKPIWAPEYSTIKDEFFKHSDFNKAEDIVLLSELYNTYIEITNSNESFDDFYFWGEVLLADFDEIDKYLINPEILFKNINEIHKISSDINYLSKEQQDAINQFWSTFKHARKSKETESFKNTWESLIEIYNKFKLILSQKSIAYEGMIYRNVADKLSSNSIEISYKKVIFVGFNALNNCERIFLKYLKNKKIAYFVWDFDKYYLENKYYEAGQFIRENINDFNLDFFRKDDNLFNNFCNEKNINFISAPNKYSESKSINSLIDTILNYENHKINFDNTVVVLADESLLVPVILSIPKQVSEFNITMGYPIINTQAFSLILNIFDIILREDNDALEYNLLNSFFNNTILKKIISSEDRNKLTNLLTNVNNGVISLNDLKSISLFDKLLFIRNSQDILKCIYDILLEFSISHKDSTFKIENEAIFVILENLKKLDEILNKNKLNLNINICIRVIKKVLNNLSIPFEGEPLSGLQIMGMLETRLLDFKNVIILSMNEGDVSGNINPTSYIPYNLRKGFGLPVIEQYEAIYSYYFYRLIQRAENIYLVYNTDSNSTSAGEMSRFMNQLFYESNHNIIKKSLSFSPSVNKNSEIVISNNQEIKDKILKYYTYISPSSLFTLVECKLKFYFKYIKSINEAYTPESEFDGLLIGNILHNVMHNIYKKFIGKEINSTIISEILKDKKVINDLIENEFVSQGLIAEKKLEGSNILLNEIVKKYVQIILNYDRSKAPFEIYKLEEKFNKGFDYKGYSFNIKGNADRLDKSKNIIKVIDYKTGSDKLSINEISDLFDDSKSGLKGYFQTLIYLMIYENNTEVIFPAIYSVKKLVDKSFNTELTIGKGANKSNINNNSADFKQFKDMIFTTLVELNDDNFIFNQTQNLDKCKNCTYNEICKK